MRKSLLIAALGAVLPMFMSDPVGAAAPLPPGDQPQAPQEAGTATMGESTNVASASSPSESSAGDTAATAIASAVTAGTATSNSASQAEAGNVAPAADAGGQDPVGDAPVAGGDVPNAAPVAVEPTTAPASATSADGEGTTSPIGASSPASALPGQVAQHLEAVYQTVVDHAEAATAAATDVKAHIGEVLHMIHNGIAVSEGQLVQKLEALFHKL